MENWMLALAAFLITSLLVLWRPGGMHELVPALIGAFVMFLAGLVDRGDVLQVIRVVWNAAMTIISTAVTIRANASPGRRPWPGTP